VTEPGPQRAMKLGVQLANWRHGMPEIGDWLVSEAEAAGIDSIWTSESYGGDAFTPLAWLAARTSRPRLGAGIAAMPARTPAATAMTAMTLDYLSNGRLVLGLGISGRRVAEGWYGVPYGKPLQRTTEYVALVRQALAREKPLSFSGSYYSVPAAGGGTAGLISYLHPLRPALPVYLAAQGPKNIALAAAITDGLITGFFAPRASDYYAAAITEGLGRRPAGEQDRPFEVVAIADVVIADDTATAAAQLRSKMAFYITRMGPPGSNYYYKTFSRLGYEAECDRALAADAHGGAAAAAAQVTDAMVADVALIGPVRRILEVLREWEASVVDTLVLRGSAADVAAVAQAWLA
jgi:F420-dependent oxidoreductase-like protein